MPRRRASASRGCAGRSRSRSIPNRPRACPGSRPATSPWSRASRRPRRAPARPTWCARTGGSRSCRAWRSPAPPRPSRCVRPGSPIPRRCAPRSSAASTCCSPTSGARLVMWRAAAILLACVVALAGCSRDGDAIRGSGTIEMDEVDVASLVGGRLLRLSVLEGDTVRAGDTLAVLDRGEVSADLAAQAAQAERAQAQARDLQQGSRPAELVIARESQRAANADLALAKTEYDRTEQLVKTGVSPPADLDRARAQRDAAQARAASAAEQVRLQEEGFRRQQVTAAKQGAAAAAAQLAGARSRADELVVTAPRSGVVLLVHYRAGELVPPASPGGTLGNPASLGSRAVLAG